MNEPTLPPGHAAAADLAAQREEVLAWVRQMNAAWTQADGAALVDYFHPEMVAIAPSEPEILRGAAACVASWQRFARTAKIHYWREIDPDVRLFGSTAVVTYQFDMRFDMAGRTIDMVGRDMLVLVKEGGRWRMVADQFSPKPA